MAFIYKKYSFRQKASENFEDITENANKENLENSSISDKIFNDFMNGKVIVGKDRNTSMDTSILII